MSHPQTSGGISLPTTGEQKPLILDGFSWDQYLSIDALFSAEELFSGRGVRVRFLENRIELMAPVSETHEHRKSNLGCLVEAWCLAKGIRFFIRGNMTMTLEGVAGGEPDESYCFHERKEVSDLVIEVALTSGGLSKREFYRKFRVPELWFWRNEKLVIFLYDEESDSYVESDQSRQLPDIDISALEECAVIEASSDAIFEFRKRCGLA